jgi:hypothetical protein
MRLSDWAYQSFYGLTWQAWFHFLCFVAEPMKYRKRAYYRVLNDWLEPAMTTLAASPKESSTQNGPAIDKTPTATLTVGELCIKISRTRARPRPGHRFGLRHDRQVSLMVFCNTTLSIYHLPPIVKITRAHQPRGTTPAIAPSPRMPSTSPRDADGDLARTGPLRKRGWRP